MAATLRNAAYRIADAPSVIVHAPPGFDARRPLQLVVFLHGYSGCVSVLMGRGPSRCREGAALQLGWELGARHDDAHTNSLFIVPQLAFMKRSGRAGAFAKPGVFRAFLEELLRETLAAQLGPKTLHDVASITLVAHSAGYETAIAVIEHGEVSALVHSVVLLDALYSREDQYERYILAHGHAGLRVVALHLGYGATYANDTRLYKHLLRKLGPSAVSWVDASADAGVVVAALAHHPIVIGVGIPPHRLMPEHHLAPLLHALLLEPVRPPPEHP